jgi:hypothetical protein
MLAVVALVSASTLSVTAPAEAAKAPNTIIKKGPSGTIASTTATFAFKAKPKAGATFKCRMDSGRFKKCKSPVTYKGLAQGPHTFAVVAKANGIKDKTPAKRKFVVDTIAPVVSITDGPTGTTSDSTPTFTFSAVGPATLTCRIAPAAFAPCASPYTPSAPLADGQYAFEVRARDAVGNTGTATRAFEVLTPLTKDLATAQAAAAFVVPDAADLDVPASCGGNPQIDCPGGVPVPPADQLHLTASRTYVDLLETQDRVDVTAQMTVSTLVPFKITYSGTTCDVSLVSANGANPTWKLDFQELFVHPPSSTDWQVNVTNASLTQVDDADIVIDTGTVACALVASSIGFFKGQLIDEFEQLFETSLCAARGSDYIGPCPAP